ncbi:MAG: nitroreductase family protein [Acidobacteria bacterium]|nr:nitroreductase family protein [Acidobacteriota bacterium]
MSAAPTFVPLEYAPCSAVETRQRARDCDLELRRRRTVRQFSDRPVPREAIEDCLRAAGTAPSGANLPGLGIRVSLGAVTRAQTPIHRQPSCSRDRHGLWLDHARGPGTAVVPARVAGSVSRAGESADR